MEKLSKSEINWVKSMLENLVRHGHIDPRGKSKEELQKEVRKYIEQSSRMRNIRVLSTIDHTSTLLEHARAFRRSGEYEASCLFFAVWLGHWFNQMILIAGKKKRLTDSEITQIIKETPFRGKSTWLFKILDLRPINARHLKRIQQTTESRNAYVHYKWKAFDVDDVSETNEWENLKKLIHDLEKTVKYLHNWENQQIFHGRKSAIRRA